MSTKIEKEISWRMNIWGQLSSQGGTTELTPARVKELRLYGGARGTYADKTRTREVSGDRYGVTVGLLHTGQTYADDLSEDCLLYHYPVTLVPGCDASDIEATKNAKRLGISVFVITLPAPKAVIAMIYDCV